METIGLIGGLGVGAAIHYYRELAALHTARGLPLPLVMIHAEITRAMAFVSADDRRGLAGYLAGLLARANAAGATLGVVPALTPHICIDELNAIAPIPVVDLTRAVREHLLARGLSRIALFGTRFVVESDLYGRLGGVEVVRPREAEIDFVHDAYVRLAKTGIADDGDRRRFVALAETLQSRDGVQAIALAGTDFAVMFDAASTPFPHVDCAGVHIEAIAARA